MKLTRRQREQILDGDFPSLRWPRTGPCPAQVGESVKVAARVTLTITRVRFTRTHWVAEYRIADDRPRLLAAGAPSEPRALRRRHWTPDEESGYTTLPAKALLDAGEAVGRKYQDELVARGRDQFAQHREEARSDELNRRQSKAVREQIKEAMATLSPTAAQLLLASIERQIRESLTTEAA